MSRCQDMVRLESYTLVVVELIGIFPIKHSIDLDDVCVRVVTEEFVT